jgi:hypothetical protein
MVGMPGSLLGGRYLPRVGSVLVFLPQILILFSSFWRWKILAISSRGGILLDRRCNADYPVVVHSSIG